MKLYKDYTKETYSFLVNDTIVSSEIIRSITFQEELITEMTFNKKSEPIDNKIEQTKVQYCLERQTARFLLYHQKLQTKMNF